MTNTHAARIAALQNQLRAAALDAAVISPSPNLRYFTGLDWPATQQTVLLVVPADGPAALVAPNFRLQSAALPDALEPRGWGDGTHPLELVASLLSRGQTLSVAAAPELPAHILIQLGERTPIGRWVDASSLILPIRVHKSEEEIATLADAARRADASVAELLEHSLIGSTERQAATRLREILVGNGLDQSSINTMVAFGPASAELFHVSGDAVIPEDTSILIDLTGTYNGYQADFTRTITVGRANPQADEALAAVISASQAGFAYIRPGRIAKEIDDVVRDVIDRTGNAEYFIHRAGHGIGLELHEWPSLDASNDLVLEEGMTFSMQPGIYRPGRFGVRVEDVGVVTKDGSRRLSTLPQLLPSRGWQSTQSSGRKGADSCLK